MLEDEDDEDAVEQTLRPRSLDEFVGQERVKEQLEIALVAAKARGEALDHVLLAGPPGLGKTCARAHRPRGARRRPPHDRRAASRRRTSRRSSPRSSRATCSSSTRSTGMSRTAEEILYPALEDFRIDIVMGEGAARADADARPAAVHARRRDDAHRPADDAAARPLRPDLPARLLRRRASSARSCTAPRASSASRSPPTRRRRSRGARAARRASRTASCAACATSPQVRHQGSITNDVAREALELLEIDEQGLDREARELLRTIAGKFEGGPVGLSTLAASLGEEQETIEDVYEPYLLQLGFIQRTPRGRTITKLGRAHIGAAPAEEHKLF